MLFCTISDPARFYIRTKKKKKKKKSKKKTTKKKNNPNNHTPRSFSSFLFCINLLLNKN